MMNYKEVKELAEKYAEYCIIHYRTNQTLPMDFDKFYENHHLGKNQMIDPIIDQIIIFLNEISQSFGKRGFQSKGKKIRSLIRTKLKEGFTEQDFYRVIEIKSKWLTDEKMHKYFRPTTLFGNKFEDYLNESTQPLKQSTDDKLANAYSEGINGNF